jgi:hypothetical protein
MAGLWRSGIIASEPQQILLDWAPIRDNVAIGGFDRGHSVVSQGCAI